MNYITSAEYKRQLDCIQRLMPELPSKVHLKDDDGNKKEKKVFYRLSLSAMMELTLHGYIVETIDTNDSRFICINPEEQFVKGQGFWIGQGADLFKDFVANGEKKNKLLWAAAYERTPLHASFFVNETEPLMVIQFSKKQLELLNEEVEVIRTFVNDFRESKSTGFSDSVPATTFATKS